MFTDNSKKQKDPLSNESKSTELSLMEKAKLYTENELEEDYQLDSPLSEPIFRISLLQTNSEEVINRETGELDLKAGWYGSQDDSFLNPLRESMTGEILFFTLTQDLYEGEYAKGKFSVCNASDGQTGIGEPGGICRVCAYYRSGNPGSCKGGLRLVLNLHLDDYEQREYEFDRYPVVVRFASKGIKPLQQLIRDIRRKYKKAVARVTVQITSERTEDQKGRKFFVPVFTPIDILDNEQWPIVKAAKAELMQTLIPEISKLAWELDDADTMNAIPGSTEDDSTTFAYGNNAEQPL